MSKLFEFGENIKGYEVPMLNEREARAAAGLMFLVAFFSFMNVWLVGDYSFIKLFITGFLLDFTIRLFINPKFSPTLILGRLIVSNQTVEYTGAPQKRFAWTLGFLMSAGMFYSLVIANQVNLITCIVCLICLTLLFFETAFGICIGCKIYNLTHKNKAQHCPGGVCEIHQQQPIQKVNLLQILCVLGFGIFLYWFAGQTKFISWNQNGSSSGYDCALHGLGMKSNNGKVNSCLNQ